MTEAQDGDPMGATASVILGGLTGGAPSCAAGRSSVCRQTKLCPIAFAAKPAATSLTPVAQVRL